ncbi:MAG: hypothetical protein ABIB71_08625 [Candidatus Woesearchaeota archaeon]
MVIKHKFFDHKGGFYFYKVHNPKTESLASNGLAPLREYLGEMFNSCPNSYFDSGPRSSALKFKIPGTDVNCVTGHPASAMAKLGLEANASRYKSNHMKVQCFMLENDKTTVAMEVPIWLKQEELHCYNELFKSEEPLTGHIDVLGIEDNNVWIWDYKPNAHQEKFASTQTYFYALMLSIRTGIPLERFRCGYFDKYYAFVFKPEQDILNVSEQLCSFVKK